jgi:hypothetical protein
MIEEVRFAPDSPLEEKGFEPRSPVNERRRERKGSGVIPIERATYEVLETGGAGVPGFYWQSFTEVYFDVLTRARF